MKNKLLLLIISLFSMFLLSACGIIPNVGVSEAKEIDWSARKNFVRVKTTSYSADGVITDITEYAYDENLNSVANYCIIYNYQKIFTDIGPEHDVTPANPYRKIVIFEPSSNDTPATAICYQADDFTVLNRNLYEYNEDGKCTKMSLCTPEGTCYNTYDYEYDEAGNQIKETYTKFLDSYILYSVDQYTYDDLNRKTSGSTIVYTGLYDDDRKAAISESTEQYSYNKSTGECTVEVRDAKEGSVSEKRIITYDASGNKIKEETYEKSKSNGRLVCTGWKEYEYRLKSNLSEGHIPEKIQKTIDEIKKAERK